MRFLIFSKDGGGGEETGGGVKTRGGGGEGTGIIMYPSLGLSLEGCW